MERNFYYIGIAFFGMITGFQSALCSLCGRSFHGRSPSAEAFFLFRVVDAFDRDGDLGGIQPPLRAF